MVLKGNLSLLQICYVLSRGLSKWRLAHCNKGMLAIDRRSELMGGFHSASRSNTQVARVRGWPTIPGAFYPSSGCACPSCFCALVFLATPKLPKTRALPVLPTTQTKGGDLFDFFLQTQKGPTGRHNFLGANYPAFAARGYLHSSSDEGGEPSVRFHPRPLAHRREAANIREKGIQTSQAAAKSSGELALIFGFRQLWAVFPSG